MIKLMKNEENFKKEFIKKYSKEEFENFINTFYEKINSKEKKTSYKLENNWEMFLEISKVGQLQEEIEVCLQKTTANDIEEIFLTYTFGIELDDLIFYALDGSSCPSKTIKYIKDILINDKSFEEYNIKRLVEIGYLRAKAEALTYFRENSDIKNNLKKIIINELNKNNYDNYIQGSSISYKNKTLKQLKDNGLKYEIIYEEIAA